MWSIARRCTLIVITLIFSSCAYDASPTDPGAHASWSVDADAMASTVVVTSVADDGSPGTLREAIATAPAGATITFDPSLAGATIVLQSQPTPFGGALHVGLDLTIEGPSPQGVTIDANQTGPVFRVLTNGKLTLRDLTVTGGETATLDGGGIIAEGDVELERVHVTGNATGASGGGIYAYANLHLTNSMVSGNESFGRGGGIRMAPLSGDLVIIESTIHDNMATDATGGGIYSEAASTLVERSTISENLSNLAGGGIVVHEANGVIRNSTISGNMASRFEGGGLLVELGTVNLSHTTIVGNRAGRNGAGIFLGTDASVAAHNTVFYDNQAGGLFESCWGGTPTFTGWNTNNDLSCGAGSGVVGIVDPLLGPLADNGGPTQTHAVERGSPLIDLTQDCPLSVDQRGVARPMGPRCESGAFEFDDYAAVAYTIDPSGTANRNDGTAVVSGTATCEVSAHVTIVVTVTQKQKVRRLNTEVSGSSTDTFFCSAQTHAWAVAVKPSPGGFVNAPVEVTVRTTVAPAYFERPTVAEPSVKLAWSRK